MLIDIMVIYVYAIVLILMKMRNRLMTKREFSLVIVALILILSTFAHAPEGLGITGRVLAYAPAAILTIENIITNTTHIAIYVRNTGTIDVQLSGFYVDEVLICESNSTIHVGESKKYLIAANTTEGCTYEVKITCTMGLCFVDRFVAPEGAIIPDDDWDPLIEYGPGPPDLNTDSDGDGMPDLWECGQGLNPHNASDAYEDLDKDGLSNLDEYTYQTNLREADTDDDGLSDGLEVHVFGTDPLKKDTDGDGISDGLEAAATGFSANLEILPENWIKVNLLWSNHTIDVLTNSSVFGITFNSTDKRLTVNVAGTDGTIGFCNLTVPTSLASSISDIEIYLDDQPFNFSISNDGLNYHISVEYNHSSHVLLASFSGKVPEFPSFLILPLFMIATLTAIVVYKRKHTLMIDRG